MAGQPPFRVINTWLRLPERSAVQRRRLASFGLLRVVCGRIRRRTFVISNIRTVAGRGKGKGGRERGQGLIQWQANSCSYNKCRREATNSERKTAEGEQHNGTGGEEAGKGDGKTTAAKLHLNNENA